MKHSRKSVRRSLSFAGAVTLLCVGVSGCGPLNHVGSTTGIAANSTASGAKALDVGVSGSANLKTGSKHHSKASGQRPGASGSTGASQPPSSGQAPQQPTFPTLSVGSSGPAVLALNERLAELGYLPLAISGTAPAVTAANLNSPPQASFNWRYGNVPAALKAEFSPESYTELTRGAVIAFEDKNGLTIDGIAGPQVWNTMISSNATPNPNPYSYVLVTKAPSPEQLKVWQDGQWVLTSNANTGVPGAQTADGTFAVYLRYLSQTMSGTNPNGTHYSDPGVPYVNYFNGGDAVHGFPRAQYGFPQSDGCVELPISVAAKVWQLVHYGTLVTVEGHYGEAAGAGGGSSVGKGSGGSASGTGSGSVSIHVGSGSSSKGNPGSSGSSDGSGSGSGGSTPAGQSGSGGKTTSPTSPSVPGSGNSTGR